MIPTFVDAGVLIAAARITGVGTARALHRSDDGIGQQIHQEAATREDDEL